MLRPLKSKPKVSHSLSEEEKIKFGQFINEIIGSDINHSKILTKALDEFLFEKAIAYETKLEIIECYELTFTRLLEDKH